MLRDALQDLDMVSEDQKLPKHISNAYKEEEGGTYFSRVIVCEECIESAQYRGHLGWACERE